MKIGVISDTHLAGSWGARRITSRIVYEVGVSEEDLARTLKKYFQDVDMVLHAGDLVDESVLDMLEEFGPVHAVAGNMDPGSVKSLLPDKKIVEAGKFRIGLIHGWGAPAGLPEKVRKQFDDVHCIVFGHSHNPFNETINGVLLFNPGSPTDRRFASGRSIGLLHVNEKIKGEIIKLET